MTAPMIPRADDGDDLGPCRPIAEINVTPFVDVMLVLLIIFMVTAPLMMVGVPVQLPKTSAAKIGQPRPPVIVTVTREGLIYFRDEAVSENDLGSRLARVRESDPDATVHLRADRAIVYGQALGILGHIHRAGFAKVSLIAEGASMTTDAPGAARPER